jgi:hypothetical protein
MSTDKRTEEIYDLLEQFSFDELSLIQQQIVLREMDEQSYSSMRNVLHSFQNSDQPNSIRGKAQIRKEIFNEAEETKSRFAILSMWNHSVRVGKVAVVLFPLLITLFWSFLRKPSTNSNLPKEQTIDTVFLSKDRIVKEILRDTVYAYISPPNTKTIIKQAKGKLLQSPNQPDEVKPTDLHIVTTPDLNSPSNRNKNNSLKHDSLAMHFKFVSL